jgi:ATP-dependent exoDNAse (exonuclease V) alpha subunit
LDENVERPNHHGIFPAANQSMEVPMSRIRRAASGRYTANRITRWAQPFTKRKLLQAARSLWPMLATLAFAGVAHAQGTMDFSGATTLMSTFKTTALAGIRQGAEQSGYVVEGFAPTSRAARQLREAGIAADSLQGFLVRSRNTEPAQKHLYIIDESSLASTQQMRDFLNKIGPRDKVLLIGDTRQHQGVDAGKPFEQLQEAGMRTAQLDQIMRQKVPELLKAVEYLSNNETAIGVKLLSQQGRITEIVDPQERIAAIAKSYAERPENTLIVSPDNSSRRAINQAVRQELQTLGVVDTKDHIMRVLTPRNDMTGADREWANRYQVGDVLHYTRGSKEHGIEPRSYAQVVAANPKENLLTVQKQDGQQVTYDPSRLRGISAYQEIESEFATGDKIQFTAPQRDLRVANRDLGTIQDIGDDGKISVRMDDAKDRIVRFDINGMRHFDHGYAVTSHSAQSLTSERVLINVDNEIHPELFWGNRSTACSHLMSTL